MELARMLESDIDEVVIIERQVYSHPWTPGNFSDALASAYPGWVLRHEGELLAYCVTMCVVDELHLLNLSVARAWQGQGLARQLLAHIEQQALQAMCTSILLEVRVSNERARELYSRWGYQQIGMRRAYYPAAQGREDAVVMRKCLLPSEG